MVAINLTAIQLLIGIITAIGWVGIQVGLQWAFKKDVNIRLKAHEDKIKELDAARESNNLLLVKISTILEIVQEHTLTVQADTKENGKKLDAMKDFCRVNEIIPK
jgi:hypothetical protein